MSQVTLVEIATVHRFITQGLEGVNQKDAWGETSYFYNPGGLFDRGTYFATIKQHAWQQDTARRSHHEFGHILTLNGRVAFFSQHELSSRRLRPFRTLGQSSAMIENRKESRLWPVQVIRCRRIMPSSTAPSFAIARRLRSFRLSTVN
jgi:hypothetical protein